MTKTRETNQFTFDFWNLKKPKPADTTVKVWIDPDCLKRINPNANYYTDEKLEKEATASPLTGRLQSLGHIKAQEKEQRIHRLRQIIDEEGLTTTEEALKAMPDVKKERTIISYLNVIGRQLTNSKGVLVGSTEANYQLLDKNNSKPSQNVIRYKYYDKDPNKGGVEITEEKYNELKKEFLKSQLENSKK